ncbi:MAG: hypothetical protein NVS1B9_02190 [Solirubrobacteraceae bacterium]
MQQPTEYRIKGGLEGAARAHQKLMDVLGPRLESDPQLGENLRLLVSELATNSMLHGGVREQDGFTLVIQAGRVIRVTVRDRGRGFDPGESRRRAPEIGGYGLKLVERIADRWGVSRADGVTSVWFEFDRA